MEKNHYGRWTQAEHEMFLQGLQLYGKNWKKIEQMIGSRTGCQIRSHAQKFFLKGKERTQGSDCQSSNLERSSMVKDAKVLQDLSADHKHHLHEEKDTEVSFLQKHLSKYVMQPQENTGIERDHFDFWNICIEAPVKTSVRKNSADSCFSDTGEHQQAENGCPQLLRTHSFIPFQNNCLSGLEKIQNLRTLH